MQPTRRDAMLAGLGLMVPGVLALSGCASRTSGSQVLAQPLPDWPRDYRQPTRHVGTPAPRPHPTPPPAAASPVRGLSVRPRSSWTRAVPIRGKVNPMRGINRITVHHEGWKPVYFADARETAARIEQIRTIHTRDRGWGDIGYHYIIDRAGQVWEGRPIEYQGAHVRANNEHNIGVLVLGNFDKQQPSQAQLNTLVQTLSALERQHRVSNGRLYTHQEIVATACPGRGLQSRMSAVRQALA